jgi:hypothetical protein
MIEPILKNKKKAEIIKAKMKGATLEAIAAANKTQVKPAVDITLENPTLPGVGQEAKVVGTAFALKGDKISAPIDGNLGVYVVKTKAKNVSSNIVDTSKAASFTDSFAAQSLTREQMSSKAMKVVKEFPVSNYTKKTYNAMEGGWETTQDFAPLSQQIKDAIQSNKKFKFANLAKLPKKK